MKCSISECKNVAKNPVKIGFKEIRNLCEYHYDLFNNRDEKHTPNFRTASKLKEK
ncbi:MAG: hypothetical protein ITD33_05095 [Nitrosarchaeum sp.]|nr:hypothetical protein [Nitrosarchaeum sp.]MBP0120212.1 hypothetical protein [Nitrosarchaeum sp.]MBP0133947.1 hypothetical protein [Nitrosarchaeum sp.]